MKFKIWGARGSLPTPLSPNDLTERFRQLLNGFFESGYTSADQIQRYLDSVPRHRLGGYGGNTPCLEVFTDQQRFMIDGGSGIRQLG